jgi:hypothetical protein
MTRILRWAESRGVDECFNGQRAAACHVSKRGSAASTFFFIFRSGAGLIVSRLESRGERNLIGLFLRA